MLFYSNSENFSLVSNKITLNINIKIKYAKLFGDQIVFIKVRQKSDVNIIPSIISI